MHDYSISRYLFNPDEAYSIDLPFEEAVDFVQTIAKENEYPTEYILIVELPEGVFIRTQTTEWCDTFADFANQESEYFRVKIIGTKLFTDLTRKYRDPIHLFGDRKLAMWKMGF